MKTVTGTGANAIQTDAIPVTAPSVPLTGPSVGRMPEKREKLPKNHENRPENAILKISSSPNTEALLLKHCCPPFLLVQLSQEQRALPQGPVGLQAPLHFSN